MHKYNVPFLACFFNSILIPKQNCIVIVNPLTINVEFCYKYKLIKKSENNLDPKQPKHMSNLFAS